MDKPVPRVTVKDLCGCWSVTFLILFSQRTACNSAYAKTATLSSPNSNQIKILHFSMAESRTDLSSSVSSSGGLAEDDAKRHLHHHHKETHGLRDDINEETPITDVKAPNVFERVKEEIEAIAEAIHPKKEAEIETHDDSLSQGKNRDSASKEELKPESSDSHSEEASKSPNLFERVKEDIEAPIHKRKSPHRHHKETHGRSDDIDETTLISEVKGPGVFQRAKEELEAILDAIHPKKDSGDAISSKKKEGGGFRKSLGRGLEKICSPGSHNRD